MIKHVKKALLTYTYYTRWLRYCHQMLYYTGWSKSPCAPDDYNTES